MYRIYYDDGSILTPAPDEAPERGVQVILQTDPDTGWYAITGHDYYVWDDPEWYGVDVFGLWDYLASPGWKRVLFGRKVTDDEYAAIYHRALEDMGPKSTYRADERHVQGSREGKVT